MLAAIVLLITVHVIFVQKPTAKPIIRVLFKPNLKTLQMKTMSCHLFLAPFNLNKPKNHNIHIYDDLPFSSGFLSQLFEVFCCFGNSFAKQTNYNASGRFIANGHVKVNLKNKTYTHTKTNINIFYSIYIHKKISIFIPSQHSICSLNYMHKQQQISLHLHNIWLFTFSVTLGPLLSSADTTAMANATRHKPRNNFIFLQFVFIFQMDELVIAAVPMFCLKQPVDECCWLAIWSMQKRLFLRLVSLKN